MSRQLHDTNPTWHDCTLGEMSREEVVVDGDVLVPNSVLLWALAPLLCQLEERGICSASQQCNSGVSSIHLRN